MVEEIHQKYPDDLKIVIKNFPLSSHKQANKAALYGLAAKRQGKFYEMFHKIMANYRELRNNEDLPLQYAVELGLDINQIKADIADPALQQQINREARELRDTGMRMAVPKFLVNGREPAKRDVETFSAMIEEALK